MKLIFNVVSKGNSRGRKPKPTTSIASPDQIMSPTPSTPLVTPTPQVIHSLVENLSDEGDDFTTFSPTTTSTQPTTTTTEDSSIGSRVGYRRKATSQKTQGSTKRGKTSEESEEGVEGDYEESEGDFDDDAYTSDSYINSRMYTTKLALCKPLLCA